MKPIVLLQVAALCGLAAETFPQAPSTWQPRQPSVPVIDAVSITFGSEGWIIADDSNAVVQSPDAKTWTRHSGLLAPREVVFEEGRYVAVAWEGTDGVIYTSTDGTTWQHEMTTLGDLASVTFANGRYVAAGGAGIFVSDDGTVWTARSPPVTHFYRDVGFANGKFVAVGMQFSNSVFHRQIATSIDSTNWTFVTPPGTNRLLAVSGGAGLFVASGDNGPILTSPDGVNWTHHGYLDQIAFQPTTSIRTIAHGNGVFVAAGNINAFYYSTDGTNWSFTGLTEGPSYAGVQPIKSIAFGQGRFIAVAENNMLYTSVNGRDWSLLRSEDDIYAIAYGNGRFVAVGSNSTVWISFNNGKDWTSAFGGKPHGTIPNIYGVTFATNTFVAVGGPGPYISTSPNGHAWTDRTGLALPIGANFRAVTYGNGLFVTAGEWDREGTMFYRIGISTNGAEWRYITDVGPGLSGVAYGNGVYVAVGDDGFILTSPDGITWAQRPSGTTRALHAVTFHNDRFIAGGDIGTILLSTDGINWGPGSPTSFSNRGLAAGNSVVAVGNFQNDGRLHYSTDGLGWPGASQSFSEVLNGVTYSNGAWVAVGNGGLILHGSSIEIRLSDPFFSDGNFEMTIHWQAGRSYDVQTSGNLADWRTLSTHTADSPTFRYRIRSIFLGNYFRVVSP